MSSSFLFISDNSFPCDCRLDWFVNLMNKTQSANIKLSIENLKCTPSDDLKEKWIKATETEKTQGQDADYVEANAAGGDYEYYDETQLNGQLFYTDLRPLLNCDGNSNNMPMTTTATLTSLTPSTRELAEIMKITTTKANPSTKKPMELTAGSDVKVTNKGLLDLSVESSTNGLDNSERDNEVVEYKDRKPNLYTTTRLATVSAKPLENKVYYDQHMASDEAQPEKIKAQRSIDDIKDSKDHPNSNADRNVISLVFITTLLCIRHIL